LNHVVVGAGDVRAGRVAVGTVIQFEAAAIGIGMIETDLILAPLVTSQREKTTWPLLRTDGVKSWFVLKLI
jgi:hypothetical protein